MRIIHVAPLISPDGAYGGPTRVAINQVRELLALGHEVLLAAGSSGFSKPPPERFDGVPVRLFPSHAVFPALGFAGRYSPELHLWLQRALRRADIVHIHMARDLVTLPAANWSRLAKVPYVVQTHGMIAPTTKPLAHVLDVTLTRPALRHAAKAFYLTPQERSDLGCVGASASKLELLRNGVPTDASPVAAPENVEVLFLARLHARKRPLLFVAMAVALHSKFPKVRFRLVGPDEGEGPAVEAAIKAAGVGDAIRWEGSLTPSKTNARMAMASLYVLPSINEPFGMTVVEAMSLGIPVVVTETCGLAAVIRNAGAGAVCEDSLDSLVSNVSNLLADLEGLSSMGRRAAQTAIENFGMRGVIDQLLQTYTTACDAK